MIAKVFVSIFVLQFLLCSTTRAADLTIGRIVPVFDAATPGFGNFSVKVNFKNNKALDAKLNIVCLYVGLTHPGVYYKKEPEIPKQYLTVSVGSMQTKDIIFKNAFRAYHPEMLGEIIVSAVGTDVVRSLKLITVFQPKSQD